MPVTGPVGRRGSSVLCAHGAVHGAFSTQNGWRQDGLVLRADRAVHGASRTQNGPLSSPHLELDGSLTFATNLRRIVADGTESVTEVCRGPGVTGASG